MKTETTLLRVKKETHDQLAQHGEYGDSMDSIIKKLLEREKPMKEYQKDDVFINNLLEGDQD